MSHDNWGALTDDMTSLSSAAHRNPPKVTCMFGMRLSLVDADLSSPAMICHISLSENQRRVSGPGVTAATARFVPLRSHSCKDPSISAAHNLASTLLSISIAAANFPTVAARKTKGIVVRDTLRYRDLVYSYFACFCKQRCHPMLRPQHCEYVCGSSLSAEQSDYQIGQSVSRMSLDPLTAG